MREKIYLTLCLLFITILGMAQSLPYSTGFDNANEQSGWQTFRLGATVQFNNWSYSSINAYSAPNALYHNYPVGGTTATDDWFVSPMFNLEEGGMIDTVWHSFAGFGTPQIADTLAIYLLIGSQNPSLASERILLHDFRTGYENDNVWRSTTEIEIPNATAHSHIAIRYKTVVNWLDVKFDDIRISGNNTLGIAPQLSHQNEIELFPNPAKDILSVSSKALHAGDIVRLSVFDVAGKKVIEDNSFTIGKAPVNIDALPAGMYVICINSNKGNSNSRFIKE